MAYTDIQALLNTYHSKLAATDLQFKRYLYDQINWNVRLIGIKALVESGKLLCLCNLSKKHSNTLMIRCMFRSTICGL